MQILKRSQTRVLIWLTMTAVVAMFAGVLSAPLLVTEAAHEEPVREKRTGLDRVHSIHVSSYSHAHVRVEWSSQYPVVRWRVERSNGPRMDTDTRVTLASGNGENFTYTDEAVVPETQYTYRAVVDFNDPAENNQLTESTDTVTFTTTAAPSTDRVIGAVVTETFDDHLAHHSLGVAFRVDHHDGLDYTVHYQYRPVGATAWTTARIGVAGTDTDPVADIDLSQLSHDTTYELEASLDDMFSPPLTIKTHFKTAVSPHRSFHESIRTIAGSDAEKTVKRNRLEVMKWLDGYFRDYRYQTIRSHRDCGMITHARMVMLGRFALVDQAMQDRGWTYYQTEMDRDPFRFFDKCQPVAVKNPWIAQMLNGELYRFHRTMEQYGGWVPRVSNTAVIGDARTVTEGDLWKALGYIPGTPIVVPVVTTPANGN